MSQRLRDRLRDTATVLWRELAKFGIVGAVAFVVDAGGTNLLYYTVLPTKLTTAKIIAGTVATVVSYIGNRYWTFRHRRGNRTHREMTLFLAVNAVALAISAGYLAFTHYALGMGSVLAINLNNVIGIGIGTLFRFWTYRTFIFTEDPVAGADPAPGTSDTKSANTAG